MALVHFAAMILLSLALELSGGVRGQTVEVLQTPEYIALTAGDSATFSCTVTETGFVFGPVRWFKGSGASRTLIYSDKRDEAPFPRVSRVSPDSNTDFSIWLTNISTEDAGTYYCIKFRKTISGKEEYESGPGTVLSVSDVPAQTVAMWQFPESIAVTAEDSATFSCTVLIAHWLSVIGPVRWYKGSREYRTLIYSDEGSSPRISRVSPESHTDWSIRIHNISTEDAGTYYCVKFTKRASQEEEHTSGAGTSLSVSVEVPGSSGVYIPSKALWIGFVVEKLCLMAFVLGFIYLKQRN